MNEQPNRFPPSGRVYLLIAITIFGSANAITRKLTDIGAENLVDGRNPISFCNVLFVGNLCALLLLAILYYRQWRPAVLQQMTGKNWLAMVAVAVLGGALVPALIFTALSMTVVNNVILISQIDTPLTLALSVWLLRDRVNAWVVAGAIVSFVGVALTILIPTPGGEAVEMGLGIAIGRGELLTVIAAILKAISNLVSRVSLQEIPLGIFSTFRMLVGTIVFFFATIVLLEPDHFTDVASPFLWQWMLLYAAVIVVGGQLFWFSGLRQSTASEVSLATAFNPIAGILAAYLVLGEAPTVAQYIGGAVILSGIALNQVGVFRLNTTAAPARAPSDKEMCESIGFKGI